MKNQKSDTVMQIDIDAAIELLKTSNARLMDIRDRGAFEQGHIEGAFHLSDASIAVLTQDLDFADPILVVCYHGVSSIGVAQYLHHLGFEQVYSVVGGFTAWQKQHPQMVVGS